MPDWKKIGTTEDHKWLISRTKEGVPAEIRAAAVRLYELGETYLASEILLKQMNQYKDPRVNRNTKYETCTWTMVTLGQLGEKRAIDDLIDAFDEFTDFPAFALALIGGDDLRNKLLDLSKTSGIKGFSAKLALGFMGDQEVLPSLIEIFEHADEYHQKFKGKIIDLLRSDIMYMLGNYEDERAAKTFEENLKKYDIDRFLRNYVFVEGRLSFYKYEDFSTLGWRIVKKYGWNRYLDTEAKRFLFSGYVVSQWEKVYDGRCPFMSQSEADSIRDGIIEGIWKEINANA